MIKEKINKIILRRIQDIYILILQMYCKPLKSLNDKTPATLLCDLKLSSDFAFILSKTQKLLNLIYLCIF